MARPNSAGPLGPPTRYVLPGRRRIVLIGSLATGALVLAGALAAYLAGVDRLVTPGPLVRAHAAWDGQCAACHGTKWPRRVSDVRCERCHDPRVTERLGVAAHAEGIGHGAWISSELITCGQCHVDHLGRDAPRHVSDPADCARCHSFRSLAGHPEFAAVRDNAARSPGIRFGHAVHIVETMRVMRRGCEACHQSTPDRRAFEPVSFDLHCAPCHAKNGALPGISDPVEVSRLASLAAQPIQMRSAGLGRVVIGSLRHRDPWMLHNVRLLRSGLDSDHEVAGRVRLQAMLSVMRGDLAERTLGDLSSDALGLRADSLRQEIARLEARSRSAGNERDVLAGMSDSASALLRALGGSPPQPQPTQSSTTETGPIEEDVVAQQTLELLRLLAEIERGGDAGLRAEAQALTRRVLLFRTGRPGRFTLAEQIRRKQYLLDRVALEIEERASGNLTPFSLDERRADEQALRAAISAAEQRLEGFGPDSTESLADDERQRRVRTLEALQIPCLFCHETRNGSFVPVAAAASTFNGAWFSHAPHLDQVTCETCHAGVQASQLASDLNMPGVSTCLKCHGSPAPAGCTECHRYHPPRGPRFPLP